MVTARMVSAADVQSVLNDMTEKGGMFYQMQAKTADTLRGRVSNLTDAFDIMYNEIGTSTYGMLSWGVEALTELIKNWEYLIPVVTSAGLAFGTIKVAAFITGIGRLIQTIKILGGTWKALNVLFMSSPFGIAAAAIGAIVGACIAAYMNVDKLNKELDELWEKGNVEGSKSVREFEQLANKAANAQKGTKEYTEAVEELKRTYGDILPEHSLQIEALKELNGEYSELNELIKDDIKQQTLKNQINTLEAHYAEEQAAAIKELREEMEDEGVPVDVIDAYIGKLQEYASTLDKTDFDNLNNFGEGNPLFGGSLNKELDKLLSSVSDLKGVDDVTWGLFDREDIIKLSGDVVGSIVNLQAGIDTYTQKTKDATSENGNYLASLDAIINKAGDAGKAIVKAGEDSLFESTGEVKTFDSEYNKSVAIKEGEIQKQRELIIAEMQKIADNVPAPLLRPNFKFSEGDIFDEAELQNAADQFSGVSKSIFLELGNEFNTYVGKAMDTTEVSFSNTALEEYCNKFGVAFGDMQQYLRTNEMQMGSWGKTITSGYEAQINFAKEYTNESIALLQGEAEARALGNIERANELHLAAIQKQLLADEATNRAAVLKGIMDLNKFTVKGNTTKGKNHQLETLKEQLALIEKVKKAYEDFYKETGDSEEAANAVSNAFGTEFGKLFENSNYSINDFLNFDDSKVVSFLNSLKNLNKETENLREQTKSEYVFDIRMKANEIDLSATEKELEDLIKGYDLSKEIDDAGEFGKGLKLALGNSVKGLDITLDDASFIAKLKEIKTRLNDELADVKFGSTGDIKGYDNILSELQSRIDNATTDESKAASKRDLEEFKESHKGKVDIVKDVQSEIVDVETAAYNERIKLYQQLLEKDGTFEERRAKIKEQAAKDRAKIESDESLTKVQKESLNKASKKQESADVSEVNLEDIEQTKLWIQAFTDLENIATSSIPVMTNQLRQFINENKNLSPDELKQINEQIEELDKLALQRNPFKQITTSAKNLTTHLKGVETANKEVSEATEELNDAKAAKDTDRIIKAEEALKVAIENRAVAENEAFKDKMEIIESTKQITQGIADIGSEAFGLGAEIAETLGADDKTVEMLGDIGQSFSGIAEMATSASSIATSALKGDLVGVIKGVIGVFKGLWTTISTWLDNSNNEITRDMEESAAKVERLKEQYSELETAVDDALGSTQIAAKKALIEQKKLILEQQKLQLELAKSRSGKHKDQEEIDDLTDAVAESQREIAADTKAIVNDVFSSVSDLATNTAKTWLEMWRSGEDALQGIRDSFKDTMNDMIVNAVLAEAIKGEVAKIWKGVEKALEDNTIDDEEWGDIDTAIEQGTTAMDAILQGLMDRYGINMGADDPNNKTSDVQKGIQGVTEQTASVVEGYMAILLSNDFLKMNTLTNLSLFTEAILAVNNQMLLAIQEGNATRKAILSAIRGMMDVSGTHPVYVRLLN